MKKVNTNRLFRITACTVSALFINVSLTRANPVRDTQDVLSQWIEVEKQISADRSEWSLQKEVMQNSIEFMEGEYARLDEVMQSAKSSASAGERKRAELEAEKAKLDAVMDDMSGAISSYEDEIRRMSTEWPAAFLGQIETPLKRMPTGEQVATAPLTMRLQNIVVILSQFDKFQSAITKETGVQEVGGVSREVTTLYYGFAYAYFVDGGGEYAGYGYPGGSGWEWVADAELAPEISQLVAVYDRGVDATFVGLPAKITTR